MKNNLGALLLWVSNKLDKNQSILIKKLDAVQNLFETSAEATASSADILEGQTAYNGTTLITGTMADQGAKEATLLAGQSYTIPEGYHDGSGRVEATDLASQTEGTAEAGGILSGMKAWVAGEQITGTMPDRRATTVTAAAVTQDDTYTYLSIPEEGCYSAESKVRALNSDLMTREPVMILDRTFNLPQSSGYHVHNNNYTIPKTGQYTFAYICSGNVYYDNNLIINGTQIEKNNPDHEQNTYTAILKAGDTVTYRTAVGYDANSSTSGNVCVGCLVIY